MSVSAPDDAFLDVNDAHLRVYGNVHADGLKLGQLEVVTTTSTGSTINFLHQHTAFTTTSNILVGTTNSDLFVDTLNSRVGILTSTPATTLDVNGTVTATSFSDGTSTLTGGTWSGSAASLTTAVNIGGVAFDGSASIVPTTFGGATFSGDVSVGTTIPNYKLHVTGDATGSTTFGPVAGLGFEDVGVSFCGIKVGEKGDSPYSRTALSVEDNGNTILHVDGQKQRVGIGATTPNATLHNNGDFFIAANSDSWTATTGKGLYIRYSTNSGQDATYIQSITRSASPTTYHPMHMYGSKFSFNQGNVGIGKQSPACPFHVKFSTDSARSSGVRYEDASSTNYWENWINNQDYFYFSYNGSDRGWIQGPNGGSATEMPNFTGQHMTFIKDIPFTRATECEGLIVSSDQNKYIKMNEGIENGSNAITINECLPVVSLSNVTNDKKCFGVISASEDPETRTVLYGAWGSVAEKEKGDTRVYINSVGEGAVWVVNTNGLLESGDYITTSNVAGYGQKQDSEFLANYTVAKITMDCDFDPVTQPVQVIKKDEDGENILDKHGQIQWEDDPSGATEKAYKIRYLDADGNITDEANAVHTAAFVGCTYHCG